jgi:PKD repeat protein
MVDWGDGSTPTSATLDGVGFSDVGFSANSSGHTYAAAGIYSVQIDVRDAQGFLVGTSSEPIDVYNPTVTPLTPLTATAGAATGTLAVATVSSMLNYYFEGQFYSAVVDYGDGSTPVQAMVTTLEGSTADVTTSGHTYAQAGTYTLTVTVRDAQGVLVGETQPTITVQERASGGGGTPAAPGGGGTSTAPGGGGTSAAPGVPSVQVATFDRRKATAVITYQGGLGGTDLAALSDAALSRLAAEPSSKSRHGRAAMKPTRIIVTPGASATSPEVVKVVFDRGRPLRVGRYLLTVSGDVEADNGSTSPFDLSQIVR